MHQERHCTRLLPPRFGEFMSCLETRLLVRGWSALLSCYAQHSLQIFLVLYAIGASDADSIVSACCYGYLLASLVGGIISGVCVRPRLS
jgi:hypothetical protein